MALSLRTALSALLVALPLVAAMAATAGDEVPGRIAFVGKNVVVTANGVFQRWRITESHLDPDALDESYVVVEVDVASLDTENERRDDHLRTADFFEVERWPVARVRVHSPMRLAAQQYRAKFDVEIRGISKMLEGTFEVVSRGPTKVRGNLTIDRRDFGVGAPKNWNPLSIANEIPLSFEAVLLAR